MRDRPLLAVTEILDDSTGIWAGDITDFSICSTLSPFLKKHGVRGRNAILRNLAYLTHVVWANWEGITPVAAETDAAIKEVEGEG